MKDRFPRLPPGCTPSDIDRAMGATDCSTCGHPPADHDTDGDEIRVPDDCPVDPQNREDDFGRVRDGDPRPDDDPRQTVIRGEDDG